MIFSFNHLKICEDHSWLLYPIKAGGGPDLAYWFANIICYLPTGAPSLVGGIYMDNYSVLWKALQWRSTREVLLWEPQGGTGRSLDVLEGSWQRRHSGFCPLTSRPGWMLPEGCAYLNSGVSSSDWGWRCSPWVSLLVLLFSSGLLALFLWFISLSPLVYCGGLNTSVPSWMLQPSRDRAGVPPLSALQPLSIKGGISVPTELLAPSASGTHYRNFTQWVWWCQHKSALDIQSAHLIPNEFSDVWLVAWNLLWWEYSPPIEIGQRISANTDQAPLCPFHCGHFCPGGLVYHSLCAQAKLFFRISHHCGLSR